MKRYNVQEFMGGGTASHTMPDGTVMPGATHEDYEAMGYQEGGAAMPVSIPQDDNQFLFDALQARGFLLSTSVLTDGSSTNHWWMESHQT